MVLYGLRLTHLDWFERPTSAKFDEPELGAVATRIIFLGKPFSISNKTAHSESQAGGHCAALRNKYVFA